MKTAVIVTFIPRTRIVIDLPEGKTLDEFIEDTGNLDGVVQAAREKMDGELNGYLCGDSLESVVLDEEVPFGSLSEDLIREVPVYEGERKVPCRFAEGQDGAPVHAGDRVCIKCACFKGWLNPKTIRCSHPAE